MYHLVTKTKLLNNHKQILQIANYFFALICLKYYINNEI
jgi:hypothetical protein